MITPGTIYAIGMLDKINNSLAIGTMLTGIALLMSIVAYNERNAKQRIIKILAPIFIILAIFLTLTPSTKLAAAMYIVPAVANNEDVKAIGGNSLEALRKLTEQWLLELGGNSHAKPAGEKQL